MLKKHLTLKRLSESALALICLIAFCGGLVYRVYALNNLGITISLILAIIAFFIIQYFYLISNNSTRLEQQKKLETSGFKLINFLLLVSYFLLIFFCFYVLFNHRTAGAVVSPWQVVPGNFFVFYALASLSLIANAIYNYRLTLPLIMLHYFLSFSVALIVYQLGYGYDPFIHRATENLIAQTGAVSPKPFYYLGQYALVVIFHKLAFLPLDWLDKLLVPFMAALFLPIYLWRALKDWSAAQPASLILIITALTLSFPFFVVTTPQNLAYLFLLLAILAALSCKNIYDLSIIFILAAAAALTHPLAGVPALLLTGFLAVYYADGAKYKKYLYALLALLSVFILPLLFYILNRRLASAAGGEAAGPETLPFGLSLPAGDNFILNFVYLYGFNLKYILGALALGGILIAWQNRQRCKILFVYLVAALALLASYFLTVKLPFLFLIGYERGDYPQRILLAAGLFLLPFILLSFYWLAEKIIQKNIFIKLSWLVFLSITLTASLYISYPRYDNYLNSRGYSVSDADLSAVNWINGDARSDFIVLANQQTSAAALSQFGFKKYYGAEPIFYYPIPTGSPLYQYYLDMVYKKPSRETMYAAMDLAGVNQGYFVLNKYWWGFKKILDEAKLSADSFEPINNGEVYVFKYERQ